MPQNTSNPVGMELAIPIRDSRDVPALQELAQTIRENKRVEVVDDPEQITREIFEQILAADSNQALNQLGQATGWRELEGIPVKLGASFRWRPSSYDEGAPIFLIVPAEKLGPEGVLEPVTLTCGSMNVIAQLMNMAARGTYDGTVVRLKRAGRASARGYYPLWLEILNVDGSEPAEVEVLAEEDGGES